jgi:hypothetical protein
MKAGVMVRLHRKLKQNKTKKEKMFMKFKTHKEDCGSEGIIEITNDVNSKVICVSWDRLGGGSEPYRYDPGYVNLYENESLLAKKYYTSKCEMLQAIKEFKELLASGRLL